jgi:hypothetical protein
LGEGAGEVGVELVLAGLGERKVRGDHDQQHGEEAGRQCGEAESATGARS